MDIPTQITLSEEFVQYQIAVLFKTMATHDHETVRASTNVSDTRTIMRFVTSGYASAYDKWLFERGRTVYSRAVGLILLCREHIIFTRSIYQILVGFFH